MLSTYQKRNRNSLELSNTVTVTVNEGKLFYINKNYDLLAFGRYHDFFYLFAT